MNPSQACGYEDNQRVTAYLAGLLFGDGCIYVSNNAAYCVWIDQVVGRGDAVVEKAEAEMSRLGYKTYRYLYNLQNGKAAKHRVLVYSKRLYQQVKEIKTHIVEYVSRLNDEELLSFVGGLFDAEGTFTNRIVVYNRNKELLDLLRERLARFGLRTNVYRFGKIYGLQLHDKKSMSKIMFLLTSPVVRSARLKNIGSRETERF